MKTFTHKVHLALTFVTGGLWLPVYLTHLAIVI